MFKGLLTEMPPQSDQWPRYRQLGRGLEDQTPAQRPVAAADARCATLEVSVFAQKQSRLYATKTKTMMVSSGTRPKGTSAGGRSFRGGEKHGPQHKQRQPVYL